MTEKLKVKLGLGTMLGGLLAASMMSPSEAPIQDLPPERVFCSFCGKLGVEFECSNGEVFGCGDKLCRNCVVLSIEGRAYCKEHSKKLKVELMVQ